MTAPTTSRWRWWAVVALALTALKLWLTRGQGIYVIGSAGHDDRLFVELAQHLARGEWLGPYHELTLAKGPFYSLFIAATYTLHLPLFFAQQLFYAAACGLFVRALRPAIPAAGARCALYLFLLWNPMSFEAAAMGRVLRQHVYGPLALMMFAGVIALTLRRAEASKRQVAWAGLLGLAAAAFYLTREEGIWLVPSLALLTATWLFLAWQDSRAVLARAGRLLGVAALAVALPVLAVSLQNYRHYGWFGTCEFRAPEFSDAYGAMLRVRTGPDLPYVPVTREARQAMARVSPRFAEVQRQFDAGLARGWAGSSEFLTHLPPAEEQIGGGWMTWALRDAVAKAGHAHSAAEAMAFYRELARELNQAADDGRLPAGPPNHGFLPPWRTADTARFWTTVRDFADFVIRLGRFTARPPPSSGSPEELQLFAELTRDKLAPVDGVDAPGDIRRIECLQAIGKTLRPVVTGLLAVTQGLTLVRLFQLLWLRRGSYPLVVAAAAWGGCATSILIHSMIETTSFPVLTVSSFAPIYPLLFVFVGAIAWDLVAAWRARPGAVPAPAGDFFRAARDLPLAPRLQRALPWIAALLALAPFLIWQHAFRELFWFADDLFLVDQLSYKGLTAWAWEPFSENFVPLFKYLWGGSVMLFGGSYLVMLWLTWLTHALNTLLLGRLLVRAGFSWLAVLVVQVLFALPALNIETLGWSVQWSAVLATTFLLLALLWAEKRAATDHGWRLWLPLGIFSAASACSFSRGVLTGPVLAVGLMLPPLLARDPRDALRRLPAVLASLLPAVAVAVVIKLNASGNHQQLGGHAGDVLQFGLTYFLFNPFHLLLGDTPLEPVPLLVLGAAKLAVIAGGLLFARDRARLLLAALLAYDLGNALLLGIGRYHTGFEASMSSRYQYASLIATLPFVAILLTTALDRLLRADRLRLGAAAAVVLLLVAGALRTWPAELADFTGWRGTELRKLLYAPRTEDPAAKVPALDFMHVERAKALMRAYDLH